MRLPGAVLLGHLILALPAFASVAPPETAETPLVREIVLDGIAAFRPQTVYRAIVLRPGGRLQRDPSTYAEDLQRRYAAHGYLGARVSATWNADQGVLTLRADEGRLRELDLGPAVEGGAAEQARTLLGLKPGAVLTEKDVRAGLRRLEGGSGGAFRVADHPEYTVEPLPEGVRLHVPVRAARARLRFDPHGPDLAPFQTRVDGTAPGAKVELTVFDHSALQHAYVYASAAYGFSADDARFAVGVQKPLASQLVVVGYEFHDMTDTDDFFRRFPVEASAGIPRTFSITEDYFRRRGHEAYVFLRPFTHAHLGVSWRHDRFETLPVVAKDAIFLVKREPRPEFVIDDGTRDAFLVTLRSAAGAPLYATPVADRESYLVREPYGDRLRHDQTARLDATLELAGHSDQGGASYRRLIAHARARHDFGPLFALTARLLLGFGDTLPPQREFALGGSGTLRGYSLKSFSGQHMALGTVEARWRPWSRIDVIGFYDGGQAWTHGLEGAGWRDDVGVGLEWPGGGEGRVRVDGAYALRPPPGQDRARVYASIVLPF